MTEVFQISYFTICLLHYFDFAVTAGSSSLRSLALASLVLFFESFPAFLARKAHSPNYSSLLSLLYPESQ